VIRARVRHPCLCRLHREPRPAATRSLMRNQSASGAKMSVDDSAAGSAQSAGGAGAAAESAWRSLRLSPGWAGAPGRTGTKRGPQHRRTIARQDQAREYDDPAALQVGGRRRGLSPDRKRLAGWPLAINGRVVAKPPRRPNPQSTPGSAGRCTFGEIRMSYLATGSYSATARTNRCTSPSSL
jgi:hypothetical protein